MPEQPNVLVVDDNALVRRMLSKALESEGYAVTSASNGLEGLQRVSAQPFEAVVSDMDMPEMDGLTLIGEVRKVNADLPVIVVSGNDQLEVVIEAMKRGASDYIFKDQDAQTTAVLAVQKAREKYRLAVQNRLLTEELRTRNEELETLNQENTRLVHRLSRFNEDLQEKVAEATEEIRARLTETRALNRVASAISSVMDVEPLLRLIMDAGREVMEADTCSLLLVDEAAQQLYFPGQAEEGSRVRIGEGIAGWVAKTGEPLRIDDAYNDPRFDSDSERGGGFRTKSVLCVPLKIQAEVRGVLQVAQGAEKPLFLEKDLDTLVSFSHHATIAIENARLYEETKRQAEELRGSMERVRWLQLQRDKLGKYVPKSVVEDIERNREQALAATTRTVECTILFADIEGFTRISESSEPTTLVRMLNRYHSVTHEVIEENDGVLDKYMGDGTMAIFLAAEGADDHPLRAVRCAVAMQRAVADLEAEWREAGMGALNVRVGVNLGNVISGSIGAEKRMDYTVVGDPVNVASRLESNSRAGEVLISDSVYQRVHGEIPAEKLKPLYVKNRTQPVQPYSIRVLGDLTTDDHRAIEANPPNPLDAPPPPRAEPSEQEAPEPALPAEAPRPSAGAAASPAVEQPPVAELASPAAKGGSRSRATGRRRPSPESPLPPASRPR